MFRFLVVIGFVGTVGLAGQATAFFFKAKPMPTPRVIVLDGAGDLKGFSTALCTLQKKENLDFSIDIFNWSHGYRKVIKDQTDDKHARLKGKELAEHLIALKEQDPQRPLILISYSAGCSVGLAAGTHLPPETLERHILLSPSVSRHYEIRPSLQACREELVVFCSKQDIWILGVWLRIVRTADEWHDVQAAGRYGFQFVIKSPEDFVLSTRLRHQFWTPDDAKLGHDGKHFGIQSPAYLKRYVIPLLICAKQSEIER